MGCNELRPYTASTASPSDLRHFFCRSAESPSGGLHHRLVVITQISQDTLLTARTIIDTDALPVPQEGFMKIVDRAGIGGK